MRMKLSVVMTWSNWWYVLISGDSMSLALLHRGHKPAVGARVFVLVEG